MATNWDEGRVDCDMDITPEERQIMELAESVAERLEKLPTPDEHAQNLLRREADIAERERRLELRHHRRNRELADLLTAKDEFDRWEKENEVMRAQREALKRILHNNNLKWVWDQMIQAVPGNVP